MRKYKQIRIGVVTADAIPDGAEILTGCNRLAYAVVDERKPFRHPKHGKIEIKIARMIVSVNDVHCLIAGNEWAGAKLFLISRTKVVEKDFMNEAEAVREVEKYGL